MTNSKYRLGCLIGVLGSGAWFLACEGGHGTESASDPAGSEATTAALAPSGPGAATAGALEGGGSGVAADSRDVGAQTSSAVSSSSPTGTTGGVGELPQPPPGNAGGVPGAGDAVMGGGGGTSAAGGPMTASGGVKTGAGAAASGGAEAGVGGMSSEAVGMRSVCPEAPPAVQKDPAADRNLVVSKEAYQQLMTREETFAGTRGELPWHSYTPEQARSSPDELFPLLVVLHGGYGREVEDGNILVDVAPYLLGSANGLLTEDNRSLYPTYIIAPHCRVDEGCDFGSNEWASSGGAHFDVLAQPSVAGGTALELIRHVVDTFQVDPSRVYLTGNSMGGGGTWEFAQRQPELFAAVLPVSGHMPRLELLDSIVSAKLPVWAFGAVNDNTNPYPDTVEAIDYIQEAGGCAWLTTYNNAGHDDALWSSPYLEPGLWPWLFQQSNPSAPR